MLPSRLICPGSSSKAFIFTELREKEISFTAKPLAAVGDGWTSDISKKVEGLSAWIGTGVTAEGSSVLLYVLVGGDHLQEF
jgi:hypothetical protein